MDNAQWESKYNQLLVSYDEFQRSTRELEEDLESDLQHKEEQLLSLSRQLEKLKYDLAELQRSTEKDRQSAALQNDRLLAQVQVLKDSISTEKKVRVRLEQANDDLEGHLRILQRENEEATERLEATIEDQVILQQDYEDSRRELQIVQEQLQKAEKLIEQLEQTSKTTNNVGDKALIDSLRAEIDALKQSKNSEAAAQPTARMRRLEGLQKIAKQREERLARKSVGKAPPAASNLIPKSGLLSKKEKSMESWKPQFCQINVVDRTLELFIVFFGTMEGGNVHKKVGSLRLPGCQLIVKRRGKRQFALQPSHSKNKTVFRCSSDEELEQWVEALQLGIVDVAQGSDATSFLRGRARTQTLPKPLQGEGQSSLVETMNDKQFVWQKENAIVKEGIAMKLKYGCEGNDAADWDTMRLKLSLGSSVIELLSLQTTARGAIPLLVVEKGELGLTRFRTADSHGNQTNVMIAHSGPFEYVLQFSSVSDRMEWMRAIRFCTTPREHDVRLEGSLFLPGLKVEDPPQKTYCTLLMSRVNPGIMNFFDAASNELVVVRCFRLTRTCVVTSSPDPCAFTLTQSDSVMLKARDATEAKQWMTAISTVLSELQDPNALPSRQSESKTTDDSVGLRGHSESFLIRPSVSEDVRLSHMSQSVDLSTRSKHGRLMEMNNSLIGANWKPRFFSLDANSRVLEYSPAGKRCVSKNCNALSEVSGGYCPQCMRKIMDGEDDEPNQKKPPSSLSRTTSFLQRLGGNSMTKSLPEVAVSPRVSSNGTISKLLAVSEVTGERDVRKPHYIPLARAIVAPLPPKKAGGRSHCFILTPHHSKRDYILQAADDQDLQDWVEVLSSRTKMEELPATSMRGLLSMRNVRATGTLVPWRPRWFVLENNVLIHRKGEHEKGGTLITLGPSCQVVVVEGQDESNRAFEFCLTDSEQKETTHFQAENKLMGKRWLAAIERAIRHEQLMVSPNASSKPEDSPPTLTLPSSPATLLSPSSSSSSPSPHTSTTASPPRPFSTRTRSSASASPHPPPPPLIIEDTSSLPPPSALTFDLSASRLETELMQQKSDLELQLRKREAELRQRDAELDEAKRLLIHLRADGLSQEPPEKSLADHLHTLPAIKPAAGKPRKKLSFKAAGKKAYLYREEDVVLEETTKTVEEIRVIKVDHNIEEEDEEVKYKKERERLEAENAQLKVLLLAEQAAKEKIREDLENERKKTESVSKTVEEEKEKREREEVEKQRMKKELEDEKKRAKQILEEEAKKKKLKEVDKLNARLQQEDAVRQMEAEKRRVHLENQWLLAEAEKQKLMREQAEKQKEQLEKQKVQAEKNSLQADKQRQVAENEKKQAEKQRLQSERQRIEAENERKRLANEVGRRAHLQQQWMLAEQEKQKLIEEEKIRIAEAAKQLKEKELFVEAEKQKFEEEKKKEGIEKLLEQQRQAAEKKFMELKKQQEDAERDRLRVIEEAEREKQRLREEAEREKLLFQAELERQKQEQEENRKALEAAKERLRQEAEMLRADQERIVREEHEKKLKEQKIQEELEQEIKRMKEEQDKRMEEEQGEKPPKEHQFVFESSPDFGTANKMDKEHVSVQPGSPSSQPSSPLLANRPSRLEVPRDVDISCSSSPGSADIEGERASRRTLRKAPPKFGTLQNLQKPVDVASLRNLFEVQERTVPATPSRDSGTKGPPPPPPYHPDTPFPKIGQPPSSPLR